MAGTDRQAFDDILREVAKRTKQDKQIDDLGGALNIPSYDIDSAQKRNNQDHSHMGSLELLRDWMRTQKSSTMRQTLIGALEKLKRSDILGECFPEASADTVTVPPGKTPPRTSGLPMDRIGDSSGPHGAEGQSHPSSSSPHDSSEQHGAVGPSHPSASPHAGLHNRTVRPANPSPEELDRVMQYVMWESHRKGNALVIGNVDYPEQGQLKQSHRPWAIKDIENMEKLLDDLGYDVQIHPDLFKEEMKRVVTQFTEQLEEANPKPQSAVVYISSHGNEEGIEGSDRNILPIRDLLKEFSGILIDRPKVLIIDACWGDGETNLVPRSVPNSSSGEQPITRLPENADIFMIHSTSYGKTAWSTEEHGSWFVNQLCEVVYSNDRDLEDLDTIMLRVTNNMHQLVASRDGRTTNGTQSTTVWKQGVGRRLFFYPGFPSINV